MNAKMRQELEKRIAAAVIKDALKAGYTVSVNDGETVTLHCSRNKTAILRAMMTTDEDYLIIRKDGNKDGFGWVRFIYGNDGWNVINDYTTNLEHIMKSANAISEQYL